MQNRRTVLCITVLALMLWSLFALYSARGELAHVRHIADTRQQELTARELENARLRAALAEGADAERMEALAREKLGLVHPGEKIFIFTER